MMLHEMTEVSLEGFQVVKPEMFSRLQSNDVPHCTIGPNKIRFNAYCVTALNNCEFVLLKVNPRNKCILVEPAPSKDRDCLRWIKGQKDPKVRSMESKKFGDMLYGSWKLDNDLSYRAYGKLVTVNQKVMLLFDFNEAEEWRYKYATEGEN